jgi:hypothetical protein
VHLKQNKKERNIMTRKRLTEKPCIRYMEGLGKKVAEWTSTPGKIIAARAITTTNRQTEIDRNTIQTQERRNYQDRDKGRFQTLGIWINLQTKGEAEETKVVVMKNKPRQRKTQDRSGTIRTTLQAQAGRARNTTEHVHITETQGKIIPDTMEGETRNKTPELLLFALYQTEKPRAKEQTEAKEDRYDKIHWVRDRETKIRWETEEGQQGVMGIRTGSTWRRIWTRIAERMAIHRNKITITRKDGTELPGYRTRATKHVIPSASTKEENQGDQ